MTAFTIDLSPITHLNPTQFEELCAANPDINFERTPTGELVIMSPTGGETGSSNATLIARFVIWNEKAQLGVVFDSSTCFKLPEGGDRSPDVAWIAQSRWEALTPEQRRKFPPICPDFALELVSPSDRPAMVRTKMQEYLDSGLRLGWLINPQDKQVEVYRLGQAAPEVLEAPTILSGEPVLSGFVVNLAWLWR
jgi:Uma2 family endonuclease